MAISRSGGGYGPPASASVAISGIDFPLNNVAGSDIRIVFDGSILISRLQQTIIWRHYFRGQTGYPAETWNSPNGGAGAWDSGTHSCGMHGHPCDGTKDSDGQRLVGTGGSGTVQYEEIAGMLTARDFIASPSSPGPQSTFLCVSDVWRRKARIIVPNGSNTDHFYYPDLENRPTEFIKQSLTTASIGSGGGSPAFYFGASDWRSGLGSAGSTSNDETPGGVHRGYVAWTGSSAPTNPTHIAAIAACNTDAQVLAYCAANGIATPHFLNMNPTPSDITDKSGNGNNPSWATGSRPTLWTGTA